MANKKGTPTKGRTKELKAKYNKILKEMSIDSQVRLVLEHLISRGSITQMEAVDEYGCYRLSARVADLRDKGIGITTIMVENLHNSGHHAKYLLDDYYDKGGDL